MKKKSNHKKNKKIEEEIVDVTKEVGIFEDFVVLDKKEPEKKKEEKIDLSFLDDWVMLEKPFSEKTIKTKSKKSRFTDLFEQIKENEKKSKEEENIKNDDSLNKTSSINTSSITTNYDSKSYEGNSINSTNDSSLSENNNNNQIKENKKNEQNEQKEKEKEKIDEKDMTLEINKVISMEDKRTTIMIKNIPNKFNKELLLSIINQHFKGTYDLFILPTDINKYKNFGYAFINFTSSYYIPYFYYMFN